MKLMRNILVNKTYKYSGCEMLLEKNLSFHNRTATKNVKSKYYIYIFIPY